MANPYGYAVILSDRPGICLSDGYVSVDGYGEPTFDTVPSGVISDIVYNSTGNYTIILQESWYALVDAHIQTVVPAGSSPGLLVAQIQEFTVGDIDVLPVSAGGAGQSITFQVYDADGNAADLPDGGGFLFGLILKYSSA